MWPAVARSICACSSVPSRAELIDDAPWDAAPGRQLDLVGPGPLADGPRVDVRRAPGGRAAVACRPSAANVPGGLDVAVESRPQLVSVLVRQVQLVVLAVQAEADGLAVAVDDLSVVQVVDEHGDGLLRHCSSFN